jgi:transcriptional regulator with XRE-family HTH domain
MAARGWTAADLSKASGIDQSVIGRWRDRDARPTPENVRRAARGLGRNIREAIVAAGHYSAEELAERGRMNDPCDDLSGVSHERLTGEVLARMRAGAKPRRRVEPLATHDVTDIAVNS